MTTQTLYQLPVDITQWDGSSDLLKLYEKGKQQQWNASTRIDWSQELFEDNPMGLSDETIPIYGSPIWAKLTDKEKSWLRYESGAMRAFRSRLFIRIVPILKEIGLFGPKVQKALGGMGVMELHQDRHRNPDRQRHESGRGFRRQEVRAGRRRRVTGRSFSGSLAGR